MRQFHSKHVGAEKATAQAKEAGARSWAGYHQKKDEQYRFDNPDLPTLEPWIQTTPLPSTRFVLVRNPYFHRVDKAGRQLPYIDRVIVNITDGKLIPAKAGTGDVDLQARDLRFDNYTFLKENAKRNKYRVLLWEKGIGSQMALYPNLNVEDPVWRTLMRDVRFRRALSMGINRHEVNEVVYFGLAKESANTVLQRSSLFRPEFRTAWSQFDVKAANALLDSLGLTQARRQRPAPPAGRSPDGDHRRHRGREHRGNRRAGARPRQLAQARHRAVLATVGPRGVPQARVLRQVDDDGLVRSQQRHPDTRHEPERARAHGAGAPAVADVGPVLREQPQGRRGARPARGEGTRRALRRTGAARPPRPRREQIWLRMLEIHAQQVYTIGIVTQALQPIVAKNNLRNVPTEGLYSWDPGSYFGMYHPDTFWLETQGPR